MAEIEITETNTEVGQPTEEAVVEVEEPKAVPSLKGFDVLQEDQCADKDTLKYVPICPSCIKDPSAPEIDWVLAEEPYLDERECEYVAVVEVDVDKLTTRPSEVELGVGFESYWDKDVDGNWVGYSSLEDWARDPARVRKGIRNLLRHFDKLENERTVCAFNSCVATFSDLEAYRASVKAYRERITGGAASIDSYIESAMPWLSLGAVALGGPVGALVVLGFAGVNLGIRWVENWVGAKASEEEAEKRGKDVEKLDQMIKGLVGSDILDDIERAKKKFGEINPYALEWSAFLPSKKRTMSAPTGDTEGETGEFSEGADGVYVDADTGIVKYQIRIPATTFNMIPDKEEDDEEEDKEATTDGIIELDNKDWRIQFASMRTGLGLYWYEYDLFRVREEGSIVIETSGGGNYRSVDFDAMDNDLINFKESLERLLSKNNYAFSYEKINPAKWFHTTVEKVEIELHTPNEEKPLSIKNVLVTADGCPPKKIKRGISLFKEEAYQAQIMFLLLEKDNALSTMQAQEPKPVHEFAKDFIYPAVKINMGAASRQTEEDEDLLGCIGKTFPLTSAGAWQDLVENLVVGVWDAFRDELTKRMCADKTKAMDPGLQKWFSHGKAQQKYEQVYKAAKADLIAKAKAQILHNQYIDEQTNPKASEKEREAQRELALESQMDDIIEKAKKQADDDADYKKFQKEHPYFKDFKASLLEKFDYEESLLKLFIDIFRRKGDKKNRTKTENWLAEIGLCGMVIGLKKLLNCLLGQVSFEDAVKILLQKAIGRLKFSQFFYLFAGLPLDEQLKVEEDVRKAMSGFGEGMSISMEKYLKDKNTANQKMSALQSSYDTEKYMELYSPMMAQGDGQTMKPAGRWESDKKKADAMMKKFKSKMEKLENDSKPKQGSIGDAAGKMVGVIAQAYIKAFFRMLRTSTLLRLIKSIPGADLIPGFLTKFMSCPQKGLVNPPLDKMLDFKKFKVNFCDPTKPVINFKMPKLYLVNPFGFILDALKVAIKKVVMRTLMELALKFLIALEEFLCKMLAGVGKGALNMVTGNHDGNPFLEAFKEAFNCQDDEDAKKAMEGALTAAGITTAANASNAAASLTAAMSMSLTTDDLVGLLIDEEKDPAVVNRVISSVKLGAPEMYSFLSTPEKVLAMARKMTDLLPIEHKNLLRQSRDRAPTAREVPFLESICPSSEDIDEWNNLRRANLADRGLTDEDADKQIENYMNRARTELGNIADALANGPDEIVQSAIQEMMQPPRAKERDNWGDLPPDEPGDDCKDNINKSRFGNRAVLEPPEVTQLSNAITDRLINTVGLNFGSEFTGWGGVLSRILSDTKGRHFNSHNFWSNFLFTKTFYYDSQEQADNDEGIDLLWFVTDHGFFPKTVGYYMYKQLEENEFNFETTEKTSNFGSWDMSGEHEPGNSGRNIVVNYSFEASKPETADVEVVYKLPYNIMPPSEEDGEDEEPFRIADENKVGYCHQVLSPEERNNFDYKMNIQCGPNAFLLGTDHVLGYSTHIGLINEMPLTKEIEPLMAGMEPRDDEKYRITAFRHFFEQAAISYLNVNPLQKIDTAIYDKTVGEVFSMVRDISLDKPERTGKLDNVDVPVVELDEDSGLFLDTGETESVSVPANYRFGHVTDELKEEHFTYVGPEGEEYNYEEEEQVLGKMKKSSDRIHILDPKVHGGQYTSPQIYIEEVKHRGWLEIVKALAPEITACEPASENVLRLSQIKEHVKEAKNKIPMDPRLSEARGACFLEIPFDRLLGKESFAVLEGVMKSIIRVNVIEQVIPTLPVVSLIEFNSRNYDDSMFGLITKRMQDDLKTTDVWFNRKIEKKNYWLCFLEQAVQMYSRMYKNGDVEPPQNVLDAMERIRSMQEDYDMRKDKDSFFFKAEMWKYPRKKEGVDYKGKTFKKDRSIYLPGKYYDMDKKEMKETEEEGAFNPFNFKKSYAHYCALAYQTFGEAIFYSDQKIEIRDWGGPSQKLWEFASKLLAIRSMESEAMTILNELVKIEFDEVMKGFTEKWKPDIADINRYILNTELFDNNSLKNFGTRDAEEKVANGEIPDIGDVNNIKSDNTDGKNQFGTNPASEEKVRFRIEKYVKLFDKENESVLPDCIQNRSENLRNVVNLDEFESFVKNNIEDIKDFYISDLFGDAEALYKVRFRRLFEAGWPVGHLEDYNIDLDETQAAAFSRGSLLDTREATVMNEETGEEEIISEEYLPEYESVMVPEEFLFLKQDNLSYAEILQLPGTKPEGEEFKISATPVGYDGTVGIRYGLRIVAAFPKKCINASAIENLEFVSEQSRKEKSFFYYGNEKFVLPIASAEIDVLDHRMEEFGVYPSGGDSKYPYDLDCLLRKVVQSPEYELLFKYIFNTKVACSMNSILSNISFLDSIGHGDGWSLDLSMEDADGEEVGGSDTGNDPDNALSWDRKSFKNTKKYLRQIFSSFYLADDFDEDDIDMAFSMSELLKIWANSFWGVIKTWGQYLPWWWKRNIVDNPYDKNGEDCGDEFSKIF